MDDKFLLFLNDVPSEQQSFVLELDKYLTEKGSKKDIKSAKNGFVVSYSNPLTGKCLLNYVFRKAGVMMRIYAGRINEHDSDLNDYPESMKKEVLKAGDCKKLTGGKCSPTCPAGYIFKMDGTEYKKCRLAAFFHNLNDESDEYILKMIRAELS